MIKVTTEFRELLDSLLADQTCTVSIDRAVVDVTKASDAYNTYVIGKAVTVEISVHGGASQHKEHCICAAIKLKDGRIIRGQRHDFCFKYAMTISTFKQSDFDGHEQGFVTSRDRFVDRVIAAELQKRAGIRSLQTGQFTDLLFSEDLY